MHRPSDIATAKLKILDFLVEDAQLPTKVIAKRLGIDPRTAEKYRAEVEALLEKINADLQQKMHTAKHNITEKNRKKSVFGDIWTSITSLQIR